MVGWYQIMFYGIQKHPATYAMHDVGIYANGLSKTGEPVTGNEQKGSACPQH